MQTSLFDEPWPGSAETLDVALERLVLEELRSTWHAYNRAHFGASLRPPVIALATATSFLGRWRRYDRSMAIARRLVEEHPWAVVLEVLRHEMAHQFVDEVLGATDETAHGPAFRRTCERLAIDPRAGGLPLPHGDGGETGKVLRRVQRLLALADSPNPNEARLAMNRAHRLMLEHNVSLAARGAGMEPRYGFRQIGAVHQRIPGHAKLLASLLGQHFFVSCLWVPVIDTRRGVRGWALEITGTTENLEIAAHVHGFLLATGERLWESHRLALRGRGARQREQFLKGMLVGFAEKLREQTRTCQQQGLVLASDHGLRAYAHRRHPDTRVMRGTATTVSSSWHDGRAAGREVVLHRAMRSEASRGKLIESR